MIPTIKYKLPGNIGKVKWQCNRFKIIFAVLSFVLFYPIAWSVSFIGWIFNIKVSYEG